MSYSLLAHLYPRIKGSQEDVATFSLGYILEQSSILNDAFTGMVCSKLGIDHLGLLSYRCQDADSDYGRPDIAAYGDGTLKLLFEAKFYAGLTHNQPASYIKKLSDNNGIGLVVICPRNRVISLWDRLKAASLEAGLSETVYSETLSGFNGILMTVLTWDELLSELIRVALSRAEDYLGDLRQLEGFCSRIESEAFTPFRPEDFGVQAARDIDRYYQVVDEVHKILKTHGELNPSTKGLRGAPKWHGYTQYIYLNGFGVSVDFIRMLWKSPSSCETPFWCHIKEVQGGKWVYTNRIKKYLSSLEATQQDVFYSDAYIALLPKPYLTLEETAEDLADQMLGILSEIEKMPE